MPTPRRASPSDTPKKDLDKNPELAERLEPIRTDGRVERIMVITIEGYNWNCPRHITPRHSETELAEALEPMRARLARLEEENSALRAKMRPKINGLK